MTKQIMPALRMLLVLTLLTGVIYPLLVTVFAQAFFSRKAGGSLIEHDGRVVGSSLIAQKFEKEGYFHPRPSAVDFNPLPSGGSNLGPTSAKLKAQFAAAAPGTPQDLIFASASGLDPDISPEAARFQIPRIAQARGLAPEALHHLIDEQTQGLQLGFLGEPRVNVLRLNLALDRAGGAP